jgi:translation initiation factor 2B subunit (eIF-2B alpha/beta/delta family)
MADIHLAVAAKRAGVPVYLVAHEAKFLTEVPSVDADTLFARFQNSDRVQTDALKTVGPWR